MASQDSVNPSIEVPGPSEGKSAPTLETPPQSLASNLVSAVPDIVIPKDSPMHQIESSPPAVAGSAIVDIPAEKSTGAEKSASVPEDAALPDQIQHDSNEDLHPAQERVVPVPEIAQEPVAGDSSESETIEGRNSPDLELDDLRPSPRCCHTCGGFEGLYYRVYDALGASGYALPLWIALLVAPISAVVMGAKYVGECEVSGALPYFVLFVGVASFITLVLKICHLFLETIFADVQTRVRGFVACSYRLLLFLTLVLYIIECILFFSMEKRFGGKPDDCNPTFYTYTRCFTWSVMVFSILVILLILLKLSSCCIRRRYITA